MFRYKYFLLLVMLFGCTTAFAQVKRVDTTVMVGKAGYKVFTNNKNAEKNDVTIKPVGFDKEARDVTIEVKGRIKKVEVDDLNNDGFPDLVLYVYNGEGGVYGNVFGISSEKNQNMQPIIFPDLLDDAKLKTGYKGHDEFKLLEGTLIRRFPVYNTADSTATQPTNVIRGIQYNVINSEGGRLKFKVVRSYEANKQ